MWLQADYQPAALFSSEKSAAGGLRRSVRPGRFQLSDRNPPGATTSLAGAKLGRRGVGRKGPCRTDAGG